MSIEDVIVHIYCKLLGDSKNESRANKASTKRSLLQGMKRNKNKRYDKTSRNCVGIQQRSFSDMYTVKGRWVY